ncbi:insulinase family protein [Deferribacteraceae bacterium V6Fe1]|nr:insulinase family protein [Deferribacteraceae bacterium V6Fe1]
MKKLFLIIFLFCFKILFAGEVVMLDNGGKFVTIERGYTDTVSISMFIKGGLFRETLEDNGIGNLFSDVWVKSSKLLDKVEFYGGSIGASITNDYLEFSLSVPYENLNLVFEELDEFINSPKFDAKIFNVEKELILKSIESIKDNPNSMAMKGFNRLSYEGFTYSMDSLGTTESVSKLGVDDVKKYYEKNIVGSDMVVSVAGKFSDVDVKKIKSIFSKLPKGEKVKIDCSASKIDADRFLEETDDKIQQAKLFIGFDAPNATNNQYIPLKILSDLMGGGMSSVYFEKLRKEKGYAYSVGAFYPSRICNSRWVGFIGLDYANAKDSIATMKNLLGQVNEIVDDEKLESVKNYVIGRILNESQTNAKVAWHSSFFETVGLGYNFMDKYIDMLRSVRKDDILKAAETLLKSHTATYILKPKG